MKIQDYTEKTKINPLTDYIVIAYGGLNYKVLINNSNFFADRKKMKPISSDFINGSFDIKPLFFTSAGSETSVQKSDEANHPGIIKFYSTAGNAANRYSIIGSNWILGGEIVEIIIRPLIATSNLYLGLMDATLPITNGIWIDINGTTLTGKTKSGASTSTTSSSYTISANSWYRLRVKLNSSGNQADFYVYDMAGSLLWSSSLTTNIPIGSLGLGFFHAVYTAGASDIVDVDWISYSNSSVQTR